MSRKLLFLFALNFMTLLFAETFPFEGIKYQDTFDYIFSFKDGVYSVREYDWNVDDYVTEEGTYTLTRKNGYLTAEVVYQDHVSELFIFSADDENILIYDNYLKEYHYGSKLQGHRDEPFIWPVQDAEATSYLTEILKGEIVEYLPSNLSEYNFISSWVEGVAGYGIGEKLSFYCVMYNGGPRRFYIINGFFSPDKPSLFYDNGRVKSLHIKCFDEYDKLVYECDKTLEDTGEMQLIEFPVRCCKLEFEITDVYPGRKYEDTAITGIFYDEHDVYMP